MSSGHAGVTCAFKLQQHSLVTRVLNSNTQRIRHLPTYPVRQSITMHWHSRIFPGYEGRSIGHLISKLAVPLYLWRSSYDVTHKSSSPGTSLLFSSIVGNSKFVLSSFGPFPRNKAKIFSHEEVHHISRRLSPVPTTHLVSLA